MKRFLVYSLHTFISFSAFSQKQVEATCNLKSATVYLQGAEMNWQSSVNVPLGTNDIVFMGLPQNVNASTIQVSASTDIIIMSAVFQLNYLQSKKENEQITLLKDSFDLVDKELYKVRQQKNLVVEQKNMLLSNKSIGGANSGVSMEQLKLMYDFFTAKMTAIDTEWRDLEQKEKKLSERYNQLQNQLNELNQKFNQPSGDIIVKVNSNAAVQTAFDISCIVPTAGWYPEYDVRSKDVHSNVTLNYKANVWQNTGSDWNNVKLKLSTGNPTVSATGPLLTTWYLDFYYPVYDYGYLEKDADGRREDLSNMAMPQLQEIVISGNNTNDYKASETISNYTTVVQTQLTAEFDISIPYDIPADGKPHMISIQDHELPASYHYYAVPKLDPDAFLTADITNWEELNLLPGKVNIFFEGTYIGQSQLNTSVTKDTLSISLGRDKSIIIKREKVKDFSKVHDIGENRKQSFAYNFSIRNTKKDPIDIKVLDQYPISNNNQIEVTLDDAAGAEVKEPEGKLIWIRHLAASEEAKWQFSFTVKYPKDQQLPGL